MSKRIVVGLDPSEHSRRAVYIACARAKMLEGTVIGVGVVDSSGFEPGVIAAGPGASLFTSQEREYLVRKTEEKVAELLADFETLCTERGVSFETESLVGSAAACLVEAAASADLIAIGTRTHFHFAKTDKPDETLRALLHMRACPVLVVPPEMPLVIENVVLPFDGSPSAVRAMRLFAYQTSELPVSEKVHLLCVSDDETEGRKTLEKPVRYLEAWGFRVEAEVVAGDPRKVVRNTVERYSYPLVVMGAYGRLPLKDRVLGKVTRALIANGTIPIFLSA